MWIKQYFNKNWVDMVHKIAEGYDDQQGEIYQYSVKRDNITVLNENYTQRWIPTNKHKQLLDHFNEIAFKANKEMFGYDLWFNTETIQYTTYDSKVQGEFPTHTDSILFGKPSTQKLTVVVGLTDSSAYEGGMLEIDLTKQQLQYKLSAGQVIIFPSMVNHRVTPVTSGIRKTLVTWYSGPMWR